MTIKQKIASDLLTKFPDAHTKTLARIAYRENKSVFTSLETARSAIRSLRGANGAHDLKHISVKEFTRNPRAPGDPFAKIPEGKTHFEKWEALQVDGPLRVLVLSDLHIPYHDREAVIAALRWGKSNGINTILLNGDIADFFSVSFWEKDPRKRRFAEELKTTREFLETLRANFPKARIIVKEGNHEERWTRYMFVKAPELLGVKEFESRSLLGLDKIGIAETDIVAEKRPVRLGDLNCIHGHEYKFQIANPVNPARGLFLKAKAFAMCSHFHQSSYHSDKNIEQRTIATWSIACLCDMHPDYAPLNNWNHGFGFVETFNNGKFEFKNHYISGGRVY